MGGSVIAGMSSWQLHLQPNHPDCAFVSVMGFAHQSLHLLPS
jgi:hypothetical protein